MKRKLYAVIMAGGKGTRFWPLSTARRPKQLLKLLSAKSLVRETTDRVAPLFGRKNTVIVTVNEHELLFSLASLTVQVTLVSPFGKVEPDAGTQVGTPTPEQLSVAVALA